jgi:hypothetical protein
MRIAHHLSSGLALLALVASPLSGRAAEGEKYLPNNSDAVLTVNVKLLLDSAVVKRNLELVKPILKADANFQKTVDALGLDPFKDIDYVLIGVPSGADPDKVVIVIQGKFNGKKVHALAVKAAEENPKVVEIERVGNDSIYKITPPGKGEKETFAALLDETTLVGSRSHDLVVEALDKKSGKKKSEQKKELKELLAKANSQQCISIVALDTVGQGDLAGLVKSLTGGFTIGEDVKMDFALNAKDDEAAKTVADKLDEGVRQVQPLVKGLGSRDKRLAPLVEIFNTLKVKPDGAKVSITAEVSESVVKKIEKMIKDAQQ